MVGCGSDATRLAKEVLETEEKVSRDFEKKSEAMLDKLHESIKNRARGIKTEKPERKAVIIEHNKKEKPAVDNASLFDESKVLHEIMKEDADEVYKNKPEKEVQTQIREVEDIAEPLTQEIEQTRKEELKEEFQEIKIEPTEEIQESKIELEPVEEIQEIKIEAEEKPRVKVVRAEEHPHTKPQKPSMEVNVDLSTMFNVNK